MFSTRTRQAGEVRGELLRAEAHWPRVINFGDFQRVLSAEHHNTNHCKGLHSFASLQRHGGPLPLTLLSSPGFPSIHLLAKRRLLLTSTWSASLATGASLCHTRVSRTSSRSSLKSSQRLSQTGRAFQKPRSKTTWHFSLIQ